MNSRQKDIDALLRLLAYARGEAKRLELPEAAQLMGMSELSMFLELSGLTIEAIEMNPDLISYYDLRIVEIAGAKVN